MVMVPVLSSNIASVGYEGTTLQVRFHSGKTYAFFSIPANVYQRFMRASSLGMYFNTHIKNRYRFVIIG